MSFDPTKRSVILNLGVGGPAMHLYKSSEASSDVSVIGFFTAGGAYGRNPLGNMKVGDLVLVQQTTAGPSPGKVSIHSVIASTANQASTSSSTGWAANYNASISST